MSVEQNPVIRIFGNPKELSQLKAKNPEVRNLINKAERMSGKKGLGYLRQNTSLRKKKVEQYLTEAQEKSGGAFDFEVTIVNM